ncbi:MAG: radical SAM family heme chaperone HemW [Gemmatimonadetes bacterium]|nr:radical SAM family heme chaperone HemW [Gemmatimonadota bacterium]MBK7782903.1 radical SAM family heme chaperone HemW [Gemmatimonadota bacterium]MBK9069047.1 radical SAM family heme chaperone HemW [Gemmatimonadota bacterium]
MHLYLHVPFCARRCSYCDFAIAVRRDVPSRRFVDQLLREWRGWAGSDRFPSAAPLATIYLGGGTPSRLEPAELSRLLAALRAERPLVSGAEVTLEANPDDVTPASAAAWAAAGVNRVSLGVQSFDPGVLSWMHRTHVAEQVPGAVRALRAAGITNLSLDLIYALPEALGRDWAVDLERALELAPDHLSLYGLTVESHTPLGRWVARGSALPSPDERYATEFLAARERLTGAGFHHYEVSNYGLPGREAVHNRAYWRRAPYLGLGPSAHSAVGQRRWWNLREWAAWSAAVEAGAPTVAAEEWLDAEAQRVEDLYLGLRTDAGVERSRLPESLVQLWPDHGWARGGEGRVSLTAEGWLRLDALVAQAAAIPHPRVTDLS